MFKFNPAPSLSVAIKLQEPQDGGRSKESTITVRYRLLTVEQYQEKLEASRDGKLTDLEILESDIESIDGVKDADGNALTYSVDLLRSLAAWYWIRQPLINGWMSAQSGVGLAREKN